MTSTNASSRRNGNGAPGITAGAPLSDDEWQSWLRPIERQRRLAARITWPAAPLLDTYIRRATRASFRLDGIDVTDDDVAAALVPTTSAHRALRSRQIQRLRNHAAILLHLESNLRQGQPLSVDDVVRWYTLISCGLSMSGLEDARLDQIDQAVRRINSPQLRLQPAIREIAALHARALAEPMVPSFNGILARLLLRYHLGQCKLPPVVFDDAGAPPPNEADLTRQLLHMIGESYDALLSTDARGNTDGHDDRPT